MAVKVRGSSSILFEAVAHSPDTLVPIAGLPVFLDMISPSSSVPEQVTGGQTDVQGRVQLAGRMPQTPGSYKFRMRTPGITEMFRSDVSPTITVDVAA